MDAIFGSLFNEHGHINTGHVKVDIGLTILSVTLLAIGSFFNSQVALVLGMILTILGIIKYGLNIFDWCEARYKKWKGKEYNKPKTDD